MRKYKKLLSSIICAAMVMSNTAVPFAEESYYYGETESVWNTGSQYEAQAETEAVPEEQAKAEETNESQQKEEASALPPNVMEYDNSGQASVAGGVEPAMKLTLTASYNFAEDEYGWIEVLKGSECENAKASLDAFLEGYESEVIFPLWIGVLDSEGYEKETAGSVSVKIELNGVGNLKDTLLFHKKANGEWENIVFDYILDTENAAGSISFASEIANPFLFVNLTEKQEEPEEEAVFVSEDVTAPDEEAELPSEDLPSEEDSDKDIDERQQDPVQEQGLEPDEMENNEFVSDEAGLENKDPESSEYGLEAEADETRGNSGEEVPEETGEELPEEISEEGSDKEEQVSEETVRVNAEADMFISTDALTVDADKETLAENVSVKLDTHSENNEEAYSAIKETFSFPDGIILPEEVHVNGMTVSNDDSVMFRLESENAVITDSYVNGNDVTLEIEAGNGPASLVLVGNGFPVETVKTTSANIGGKVYTEEEFNEIKKDYPDNTEVVFSVHKDFLIPEDSRISVHADIMPWNSEEETSMSADGSIEVEAPAFSSEETTSLLALDDPTAVFDPPQRTYSSESFSANYSVGSINSAWVTSATFGPGFTIKGHITADGTTMYAGQTNTARDDNIYVIARDAVRYNNKKYHLKIYTWVSGAQNVSYAVSEKGAVKSQTQLYDNNGQAIRLRPTNAPSQYNDGGCIIYVEPHVIDDNGNLVDFRGVIGFKDLDTHEGFHFETNNGWSSPSYTGSTVTGKTTITRDRGGFVPSTGWYWTYGTQGCSNADEEARSYWEVYLPATYSNPFVLAYHAPTLLQTSWDGDYVSIYYYLTSDSDASELPSFLSIDSQRRIYYNDNAYMGILPVDGMNAFRGLSTWENYTKYGTYTVDYIPDCPGYEVQGWGNVDNFNNGNNSQKVAPLTEIQASTDLKFYVRLRRMEGNLVVKKNEVLADGTTRNGNGWTFTLSGYSTSGEPVNLSQTTTASGTATFSSVPVGTYTLTETVNDTIWSTTNNLNPNSKTCSVTISDNNTVNVTYTNTVKKGSVTVTKTVDDPTGEHTGKNGFVFKISGTTVRNETYEAIAVTNTNGIATFNNVEYGSYTVTEIGTGTAASYTALPSWWAGPAAKTVTLSASNSTGSLTFSNRVKTGSVKVTKVVDDPSGNITSKSGFEFRIHGTGACGCTIDKKLTTNASGEVTFTNLPIGTYTVEETKSPGSTNVASYWTVAPATQNVTVTDGGTAAATIKNTLKVGSVKVTKTITGSGSLNGFKFRLTGTSDANINVRLEGTTNASGICTFTNVPTGTYTLTEYDIPSQYTANPESQSVTVAAGATAEVSVNNEFQTGKLTVTKTVVDRSGNVVSPAGFVFTLSGTSTSGETVNRTGTSNAGGICEFNDLPIGTYTLTETGVPGSPSSVPSWWTVSPLSQSVTITSGGTATATVTNTYKVGNVKVIKNVIDPSNNMSTKAGFKFRLSGTSTSGISVNKTGETNAAGELLFENLPIGSYTVTEIGTCDKADSVPSWWAVDPLTQSMAVTDGGTATANVTNTYKTGNVHIKKTIPIQSEGTPENFVFNLSGTSDSGKSINLTGRTDANGNLTFSNVPIGTYTVVEVLSIDSNGYVAWIVDPEQQSVTISYNGTAEAAFTNERNKLPVSFRKVNEIGELIGGAQMQILKGSVVVDSWTTVAGQEHTVNLIPDTYVLHEVSVSDSSLYKVAEDITFTLDTSGKVFVNGSQKQKVEMLDEYYRNDLQIKKEVTGSMGSKVKEFEFTVTLSNPKANMTNLTYEYNGTTGTFNLNAQGKYTFRLTHGETFTIKNLAVNTTYTVTEADYRAEGYRTTSTGTTGTIVKTGPSVASFTNNRDVAIPTGVDTGQLSVSISILLASAAFFLYSFRRKRRLS